MYSPTQLKAGTSKKMQLKYNRLVVIKEKLGDTSYKVTDSKTGEELKFPVHVDNLRTYIPDQLTPSIVPASTQGISQSSQIPSNDSSLPTTSFSALPVPTNPTDSLSSRLPIPTPILDKNIKGNREAMTPISQAKDSNPATTDTNMTKGAWYNATSLLQSKTEDGKKYYLVQWSDNKYPPSWEEETNISDSLIQHYNTQYWPSGREKRKVITKY